jgi:hypothetical protein
MEAEASLDKKDTPLPPSRGAKITAQSDDERWMQMMLALKQDLRSISAKLAENKKFLEIEPGQSDYDTCFREWWLAEAKRLPNGLLLRTMAGDEDATEAGITKYRGRLTKLARQHFGWPGNKPVNFHVMRKPKTPEELAAEPQLPPINPRDVWGRVKSELEYRIGCLPRRESAEAMNNYRGAIEATRLLRVEMDNDQPVWTIYAVNPKKTMAVLGLLRKLVTPAIRKVTGGEVQIVVVNKL